MDAMKNNGGAASFYTEDVGTRRYRGKVILLINKETGSASEGFAWMFPTQRLSQLVPEPFSIHVTLRVIISPAG